jgi:hypothetical protein
MHAMGAMVAAAAVVATLGPGFAAPAAAAGPALVGFAAALADSAAPADTAAVQPAVPAGTTVAQPAAPAGTTAVQPAAPADTTAAQPAAPADTAAVQPAPPADTTAAPAPQAIAPATVAPAPAPDTAKATPATTPAPPRAEKARGPRDPFARGATWVTLRAGYARSGELGAGNGNLGYGAGLRRLFLPGWSAALFFDMNTLGTFGEAKESEWPFTLEIARHFNWKTAARPYFAFGGGAFHHEITLTGRDSKRLLLGTFAAAGLDVPVSRHGLVGMDARYEYITNHQDIPNPVFGGERSIFNHYTIKLTYSHLF